MFHKPDALDLLDIEERIQKIEEKLAVLKNAKGLLIPGRHKKEIAALENALRQENAKYSVAKEFVAASKEQTEIVERERLYRSRKEVTPDPKKTLKKEIARAQAGVPETQGQLPKQKIEQQDPMAGYRAMKPEQKQKLQADMLESKIVETEAPSPDISDFNEDDWLRRRELKLKLKRKGPGRG